MSHAPETLGLSDLLFLAWITSPAILACTLIFLWPLIHMARTERGRARIVWCVLLACDVLLIVVFGLLAASFLTLPR